ncbi:TetR/AcrR family transcriptional regulator [Allostreptomyces psammosilenae]|uniref:AcrR family transcriptional regulator n=1 Tax=Allostreptomyces psammosilenae TaxID=1892865 RepID=A0A852ZL53_9ACTN|nr:AcrR family transcriptional regulator [Allostreptomyces psammosilenae]
MRDATLAELALHGYAGLTVENVAERSGVHKTTVYRRWGGVDGLVVDALDLAGEDSWRPPDTGSLEGDLRGLADEVRATFADAEAGAAPSAFVAAAFHSERAAAALHAFFRDRHARSAVIVERAERRGEVPAGTDAGAVVRATTAPLYFRLFITGEPMDGGTVAQAVGAAVAAARAGVFAAGG